MVLTANVISTDAFWRGTCSDYLKECRVELWWGNPRWLVLCMRIKARFPYLLSLMHETVSWDQRLRNAESGKLTDSEKTENRQEQLYLCYDRKEIVYAIRPLNQRRDLIDGSACLGLVCQGQDELHCSTGVQPVFRETRQQRVAVDQPWQNERQNQILRRINR